jgi:hypothetical protein
LAVRYKPFRYAGASYRKENLMSENLSAVEFRKLKNGDRFFFPGNVAYVYEKTDSSHYVPVNNDQAKPCTPWRISMGSHLVYAINKPEPEKPKPDPVDDYKVRYEQLRDAVQAFFIARHIYTASQPADVPTAKSRVEQAVEELGTIFHSVTEADARKLEE